jgi:hypothetical protein
MSASSRKSHNPKLSQCDEHQSMPLKRLIALILSRRSVRKNSSRFSRRSVLQFVAKSRPRTSVFDFLLSKFRASQSNSAYLPVSNRARGQQIRLVRLSPAADFNAEVQCELLRATLKRLPEYEALSYTWGDLSVTVPVLLSGHLHHVTKNLAAALRHLRHPTEDRILWIDALCINQQYEYRTVIPYQCLEC